MADVVKKSVVFLQLEWAILALAGLKTALGLLGRFLGHSPPEGSAVAVYVLPPIVFTLVALILLLGNRGDRRCFHLAVLFFLSSSALATPFVRYLTPAVQPRFGTIVDALVYLRPDAFIPLLLWLFARDFPQTIWTRRGRRVLQFATVSVVVTGATLFTANVAMMVFILLSDGKAGVAWSSFVRQDSGTWYSTIVYATALPSLPFMLWKSGHAPATERRRVQLFLGGLVAGAAPLVLIVLAEGLLPPFHRFMSVPSVRYASGFLVFPALMSVPISAAYAVLVHKVMDVRIIIRKAVQYALARYTVASAAALPLVAVAAYVYVHREETVVGVLAGRLSLILAGASAAGWMTLRGRQKILKTLDRRFFREQYSAITILSKLATNIREIESGDEIERVLLGELERALHPEAIHLLLLDAVKATFVGTKGGMRPLESNSEIAVALRQRSVLDVDFDRPGSLASSFPVQEREWLGEGALQLIVGLVSPRGDLIGMIALAEKKSELPYSGEDKALITASAHAASLALDQLVTVVDSTSAESRSRTDWSRMNAFLCDGCGIVTAADAPKCSNCGGLPSMAEVPYVLHGKFRFERLIGAGGMGVVYRARDLGLDRDVAIKTLPRTTPEYAIYLRREARAIAAVKHPHLAVIYGAETWRGKPMLIFEYLPAGNLADRIRSGPAGIAQVIRLGMLLAGALEVIHNAGILHGDIKPSNIAFQDEATPKILDFGLAHIMRETLAPRFSSDGSEQSDDVPTLQVSSRSGGIAGTPPYMCPEFETKRDWVGTDIWALSMVLYEALTGVNPMIRDSLAETLKVVRKGKVPNIRQYLPDCPEPLPQFFADSFSKELSRRPPDAKSLKQRLSQLSRQAA